MFVRVIIWSLIHRYGLFSFAVLLNVLLPVVFVSLESVKCKCTVTHLRVHNGKVGGFYTVYSLVVLF
jgi:hypothetical protein